jgi:hypothetical protein
VSDIDTAVVDSLKALDPEWPIREADISPKKANSRFDLSGSRVAKIAVMHDTVFSTMW